MAVEEAAAVYGANVLRLRVAIIVATVLFALALGAGTTHIHFAADARVFFGENNPERIALDELEDTYSKSTVVLFVLSPKHGDVFTPKRLTAIAQMTEEAWQLQHTIRVDSIANFNTSRAEGDDIIVAPLYDAGRIKTSSDVQAVRKAALNEPEIVRRLISPSGDVVSIVVTLVLPDGDRAAVPSAAQAARKLAAQWRARQAEFEVRLTGGVIADKTFAEAGQRDKNNLIPLMSVLVIGSLLVFLRSVSATAVIFFVIAMAVVAAIGSAGWFGLVMNAATASSPIAIMVIVIASSVHLILTWLQLQRAGADGKDAVRRALTLNVAPITVTNITTAIGFLCMNFSESPPLRDMGNVVALGALFGWVFTLSTLPALLSYLAPKRSLRSAWAEPLMRTLAELILKRRVALLCIFAVILPTAAIGLTRIEFDDDYVRYFDTSFEFRRHTDYAEQRLTGLNVLRFSLNAGEAGAIFEPEFLNRTDRFVEWLEEQNAVVFVDSVTDLFKRLNRTMNGDNPAFYKIASSRPENAQNLLLYELGLPVGHDLNSVIDIDRSSVRVSAVVRGASSKDIRTLGLEAEQWLKQNSPEIAAQATGMSIVFAYISERNIQGMIVGTLLALLLVSAIMLPTFQSVKFGLISLVPNLAPALIAFGFWGYTVGQVNLASSVVCSMTLGIVVDDTVHIMMKYLRARRVDKLDPERAVLQVMPTVGLALLITTVALGLGFAVISSSGFQLSQHLGSLTMIIVAAALIADFFLLLPLVVVFDRWLK